MKKFLWLALLGVLTMTACSKDDKPKDPTTPDEGIEITAGNENQTIYADETEAPEGIQFTATSAWTADVKASAATRANSVDWVRLLFNGVEKYNGDAGSFTMTVELSENTTGRSRTVTITLVCGDTRITITIVQDGRTEEEAQSDESNIGIPAPGSRLVSRITSDGYATDFTYDAKNRVVKTEQTYTYDDGTVSKDVSEIAYTSNGLVIDEYYFMNGQEYERETITLVVGSNGYAISGTEEDEDSSAIWEAEYDAGGYLARHQYDDEGDWIDYTWSGGNITEIGYTWSQFSSVFEYGDVANNPLCNLDLFGWIISMDVNDSHASLLRLLGKSTAKMPTRGTDWPNQGEHASWSYETDSRGFITKIIENDRADYGFNSTDVITITYTDSPPEPPTPTTKYVSRITATGNDPLSYAFAYDTQNRVSQITRNGGYYDAVINFAYNDANQTVAMTIGEDNYTLRLNANGAIESAEAYGMPVTASYTNNYLDRFVLDPGDPDEEVFTSNWSGGNKNSVIHRWQESVITTTLSYNAAWANNPQCNLDLNALIFASDDGIFEGFPELLGLFGKRSAQMISGTATDGGNHEGTTQSAVEYNTAGFVTKITETESGQTTIYTITYK